MQTDGSIQIKNYVGFLQNGKTKLQILPKIFFGDKKGENVPDKSLLFLFRLLHLSGYLSFKDISPLDISTFKHEVLEIFIRIFIEKLLTEFNKTPHFEYVEKIENQQIIKGKILFSETIKQNLDRSYEHVVQFDEFSMDNSLNQLFKYVVFELLKSSSDGRNKMLLRHGITLMEDVNFNNITPDFFKRIQFNRQNERFRTLYNFAKLFFYNNQPGLSYGNEKTFSFIVPLNLLFEKTIKILLKDIEKSNPGLEVKYHNKRYFARKNNSSYFLLEPDFIIKERKSKKVLAILDTKFKAPFNGHGESKVKESDLYQLTTYAAAFNCNKLFIIYPQFLNAINQDFIIGQYNLSTWNNNTILTLLQVDITNEDISGIMSNLNSIILEILNQSVDYA